MINKSKLISLLTSYNIPYAESGKNIKQGNIGINCPFCENDVGNHLGLSVEKGKYACWKNANHTGNIEYVIAYITGLPIQDAKRILYEDVLDNFCFFEEKKENEKVSLGGANYLSFPSYFKDITNLGSGIPFYNYLKNRGFTEPKKLIDKYYLKYAIISSWTDRIIIPIYYKEKLVSWTGRSIKNTSLRYKDLSIEESVRHIKNCLLDYDNLTGGNILFICEGPFDAMKLAYYTDDSIHATCIFTTSIRDEQLKLLSFLSDKYDKLIYLSDKGAEYQTMLLFERFSFIRNISVKFLPDNIKDPGDMTEEQIQKLIKEI